MKRQTTVREIEKDLKADLRFRPNAMKALQKETEAFSVERFEETNKLAIHASSVTIQKKDMVLGADIMAHKEKMCI